jgi:hypothetical protein
MELLELEIPNIDVEAVLAAAYLEYKTHGLLEDWGEDSSDIAPENDYMYRPGFGGLRLPLAMPDSDPMVIVCT